MNLQEALAALAATNEKLGAANTQLATETTRADAAVKAQSDAEAALAKAQGEAETTRKDADLAKTAADKSRKDAEDSIPGLVASKVALLTQANAILGIADKDGKAIDRSAMSAREIKVSVVKHVDGDDLAPDRHDAYVDAMYDGAVKRHAAASASVAAVRQTIEAVRQDGAIAGGNHDAEAKATAAMVEAKSNAWTKNSTTKKDA